MRKTTDKRLASNNFRKNRKCKKCGKKIVSPYEYCFEHKDYADKISRKFV